LPFHLLCFLLGGGSTASYTNVQTTIKAYTWSDKVQAQGGLGLNVAMEVAPESDLCTGGGLGAIVLACIPTIRGDNKWAVDSNLDMHTDLSNTGGEEENQFSITWSYTTSDDPRLYVHFEVDHHILCFSSNNLSHFSLLF